MNRYLHVYSDVCVCVCMIVSQHVAAPKVLCLSALGGAWNAWRTAAREETPRGSASASAVPAKFVGL